MARSPFDKKKKIGFPKPPSRPSAVGRSDPVVKGRKNVIFEPNVLANDGNAEGTLVAMDGVWVGESTNEPQPDAGRPAGLRGMRERSLPPPAASLEGQLDPVEQESSQHPEN